MSESDGFYYKLFFLVISSIFITFALLNLGVLTILEISLPKLLLHSKKLHITIWLLKKKIVPEPLSQKLPSD